RHRDERPGSRRGVLPNRRTEGDRAGSLPRGRPCPGVLRPRRLPRPRPPPTREAGPTCILREGEPPPSLFSRLGRGSPSRNQPLCSLTSHPSPSLHPALTVGKIVQVFPTCLPIPGDGGEDRLPSAGPLFDDGGSRHERHAGPARPYFRVPPTARSR